MSASVLLPNNKSKQLASCTLTGSGTETIYVGVEQAAAAFTLHVSALAAGSVVTWRVCEVGATTGDVIVLYTSDNITAANMLDQATLLCRGPVVIEVFHGSDVTFTLRGKGLDVVPPAEAEATLADLASSTADWQRQVTVLLREQNRLLTTLINHARIVTCVEPDEGDIF